MPGMDGYEATRLIRSLQSGARNPRIPIIALTADAISGDRDRCLEAGMNDYIAKPVEPRQLAKILEQWLAAPAAAGGAKPPGAGAPPETTAIFDPDELLARLGGDRGLARRIVAGFLNDFPGQLRILKDKLADGDARGVQMQAHALKGASATVSAPALRALFSEMQQEAAAGQLAGAAARYSRMEEQFELLKSTLKQSGWT